MALKTNSKEVKATIKAYLMGNFKDILDSYSDKDGNPHSAELRRVCNTDLEDYSDICGSILELFFLEKLAHDKAYEAGRVSRFEMFRDWVSGLCSAVDSSYYYNVCAVDLLGGWLQQTEAERNRYSEAQAEEAITRLLWRELTANANRTGILY